MVDRRMYEYTDRETYEHTDRETYKQRDNVPFPLKSFAKEKSQMPFDLK
jgi:hypothetical protein